MPEKDSILLIKKYLDEYNSVEEVASIDKVFTEKIKLGKPKPDETKQLIRTVIRMSPKEQDEMKEVEEDTPTTGLMGKPKEEEE